MMELVRNLGKRISYDGNSRQSWGLFLCLCGTVVARHLGNGKRNKSCGCARYKWKHGKSKTPLHTVWLSMKDRCRNPNSTVYRWYGARGVFVDEVWNDYVEFEKWALANGYAEGLEIDRINNDGPYSPSNCRFVNHQTNMRNSSVTKLNYNKARQIRELYKTGNFTQAEIGNMFSVTGQHIGRIISGKEW